MLRAVASDSSSADGPVCGTRHPCYSPLLTLAPQSITAACLTWPAIRTIADATHTPTASALATMDIDCERPDESRTTGKTRCILGAILVLRTLFCTTVRVVESRIHNVKHNLVCAIHKLFCDILQCHKCHTFKFVTYVGFCHTVCIFFSFFSKAYLDTKNLPM